jgi:hypothetical protein
MLVYVGQSDVPWSEVKKSQNLDLVGRDLINPVHHVHHVMRDGPHRGFHWLLLFLASPQICHLLNTTCLPGT